MITKGFAPEIGVKVFAIMNQPWREGAPLGAVGY